MNNTPLARFMEKVMNLNAGYAGMGGASAGIVGAASTNNQIINSLRGNAVAFATEYIKQKSDSDILVKLSQQLEGSLQAVQLIHGISDNTFEALVTELHVLVAAAAK